MTIFRKKNVLPTLSRPQNDVSWFWKDTPNFNLLTLVDYKVQANFPNQTLTESMPFRELIEKHWASPAMFTQYDASIRLAKSSDGIDKLTFYVVVFDVDAHIPQAPRKANLRDFWHLVYICQHILPADNESLRPNIIWKTNNGARLLYLIQTFIGADEFEQKRMALYNKIKIIDRVISPYTVDPKTPEGGRVQGCPNIITKSGRAKYSFPIVYLHTLPLNLSTLYTRQKKPKKLQAGVVPKGNLQSTKTWKKYMDIAYGPGERNTALNKFVYKIARKWPEHLESHIEAIRIKFINDGLSEDEVNAT